MKILITGGAGYIGSHIAEELLKQNRIIILDNLSTGYKKLIFKKTKFYHTDIRDFDAVKKIIHNEKIDTIIHLAAKLSLQESKKKPKEYFCNNVLGTKNLLKAMRKTTVKNIIFSSTAAVYSGNKHTKFKESHKPRPNNIYGRTKLNCELLIQNFCKKNLIKFVILRYFNVVGASKSGRIGQLKNYGQLFKILSKAIYKKNKKINIYGNNHPTPDGYCIRDFIDINDIVQIHSIIIKKLHTFSKGFILNCGYGNGLSVIKIVKTFEKIAKKNFLINILKKRKNEVSNIYADNNKIKKKLKWEPEFNNLILTIERCLKWEKKIINVK